MKTLGKVLVVFVATVSACTELTVDPLQSLGLGFEVTATARAEVGRPLTPLSYSGVARRSSRRVVRRTTIRVTTLPAGCLYGNYYGGYYYRCGGSYYAKESGVYVKVVIE